MQTILDLQFGLVTIGGAAVILVLRWLANRRTPQERRDDLSDDHGD